MSTAAELDAAVVQRRRGAAGVGIDAGEGPGAGPVPDEGADGGSGGPTGRDHHGGERQDQGGGARQHPARRRVHRVRQQPAADGLRRRPRGEPGRRVPHDPIPARRGRRHHPVQLPVDGAAVDDPDRSRLRQRLRAEAVGADAAERPRARPAARRGRPAAGVFSVVNGDREVVEAICDHPDIKAIGFVGSTRVAQAVYRRGTSSFKRVRALGGAKNHLVVVPDADPEMTAANVVASVTGCAGQRCMAAAVLVAVGEVDHIIDRIRDKMAAIVAGRDMGPMISEQAPAARLRLHRPRRRGQPPARCARQRGRGRAGRRLLHRAVHHRRRRSRRTRRHATRSSDRC